MQAVVYHGPKDFRLEQTADPALEAETDVIVEVEKSAICGSDLHLWHSDQFAERGFAIGHEGLGTVAEVGSGVRTVAKGDRVLISCTTGCGICPSCRRGLYSGCPVTTKGFTAQNVFGFSNALPGIQAEAVRVPFADANLYRLPASLSDEQCLFLTDILPTGYLGSELAGVSPGDTVVVFGCGPVGALAQRSCQVRGAARVIAVDLDPGRLARATERGCIAVQPDENLLERVMELTGGMGADAAIEAVGLPELVRQAALVTRHGGTVAVIGVVMPPVELEWMLLFSKNLTLRTGLVNPQAFIPQLVPLVAEGRLDPTEIITHRYPLSRAEEAYDVFANHRDDVLKVVLDVA